MIAFRGTVASDTWRTAETLGQRTAYRRHDTDRTGNTRIICGSSVPSLLLPLFDQGRGRLSDCIRRAKQELRRGVTYQATFWPLITGISLEYRPTQHLASNVILWVGLQDIGYGYPGKQVQPIGRGSTFVIDLGPPACKESSPEENPVLLDDRREAGSRSLEWLCLSPKID